MFDREDGPGHDRGFAFPSPGRADEREANRGPERSPEQVVQAKFAEANKTLATIADLGIPKLAAAQPFAGDRRGPRQRRTEYDLVKEEVASQFKSAETAKTTAIEHAKQHGVDTTALVQEFDRKLAEVDKKLQEAPKTPPRFQRVPGEDAILAAIRMPPGEERNTELLLLVSELDRRSARTLHGRLDAAEPDSEDELAQAFKRVVAVRDHVLGILDGTKKVRIDQRKFRRAEKGVEPAPPHPAADPHGASAEAKAEGGATPPVATAADRGAIAVTLPTAPPTTQNDVQRQRVGAALPMQRKASPGAPVTPEAVASKGFQGDGEPLPHIEKIQRSFGRHDVMDVRAHQGPAVKQAAAELGAEAYASGRDVGFATPPDLRTASHEAAHVVQQRLGVQLMGGIDGGADDPYERHADQVAEEVVAGRSAEALLDQMTGGGHGGGVQRSPKPGAGAAHAQEDAPVPARGDYLVERTAEGSYVFVFNTFDRRAWTEPVFTGLRYYMQQVFPGVGNDVIRSVFTDLKVRFDGHDLGMFPDDKRYELRIHGKLHRDVIAWMAAHHPELAPREPKQGGAGLREGDGGAEASHDATHGAQPHKTVPHATTMTAGRAGTGAQPADKVSAEVEQARALYERLCQAFPAALVLRDRAAWPDFLEFTADHAQELQKFLGATGPAANRQDLLKLLSQFRTHREAKEGDRSGEVDGHADGKLGGEVVGARDGDVRTTRDGGIEHGSIYGEPGGDALGWHHWEPKGQLRLRPAQPTYIAGSSIEAELAWDLSVHPDAGQILLPNHCSYAWTVHRGGKLIDSAGRSVFADDRRTSLDLGKEPGRYDIAVTATSKHFKTDHHRFAASVTVQAVSEPAFDRAAFDQAQLGGPDAAFSRDDKGALHLRPGQTARTTKDEIGSLDLTRGGLDTLAAQGKISASDHDVAATELAKQREALVEIQAKVQDGTPYVVRGTFVSREDSSTTPLRLMMHVLRRSESGGVARYALLLHDTTFGEAVQHPGSAAWRLDHDNPAAVYRRLEGEALDEMAAHFHAHNDYPKGTIHLAAQRLADGAVWEKTLDTDNGRKTAKKILGTAALVGGAALMIVPGGSVVAAGLMVVTSTAGVASVALEIEDRIAKEGHLKLDRRLAMDVLQVVAISLPFGTLTKTFAEAALVGKGRFLLCMTGVDAAQGFVIAADVKQQLSVIEANTAVQLAGATSDEQRTAIHAERDRRVAEVIGGAVVNGGFLLVSLGHGIKRTIAMTRAGARFAVREPVHELVKQGREWMEQALSTDTFEHEGQRVQLTDEERRYLEHEVSAHEGATQPGEATALDSIAPSKAGEHDRSSNKDPATSAHTENVTPAEPGTQAPRTTEQMPNWARATRGRRIIDAAHKAGIDDGVLFNLTDEQIAALDRAATSKSAVEALKALRDARLEPAIHDKLGKELERIRETAHPTPEPTGCFVAGTLVWTADGLRPIETLVAGACAVATDMEIGVRAEHRVVAVFERMTPTIVELHVGGEVIACSREHPFWVPGAGWQRAGDLVAGTRLLTVEGELALSAISIRGGEVTVYNIEVAGAHTYHVGARGILVHNKANAHEFFKLRKQLVEKIDTELAEIAQLEGETTTTGEGGKVDTTKRTDIAQRLAAAKRTLEDTQAAAKDLTIDDAEMLGMANEDHLKASDELASLKSDIAEAKKPFADRMKELSDGIAAYDKRVTEASAKNAAKLEAAKEAEAEAGSDEEAANEAKKQARTGMARRDRLKVAQEKAEALKRSAKGITEDPSSDSGITAQKANLAKAEAELARIEKEITDGHMFGENGPKFFSKTMWVGDDGYERIDAENPSPGQRPGQIHYQPKKGIKWYYDEVNGRFYDQKSKDKDPAPASVQAKLQDPEIRAAIDEALKQMGEKR